MSLPDEAMAKRIAQSFTQEEIRSIKRFANGLAHHVYDVVTESNYRLVVRMSTQENLDLLKGGVYWSERLRPLGVPMPEILHIDTDSDVPCVLMERLDGTDLGDVYSELTSVQKYEIADSVSQIQQRVSKLPHSSGFGFVTSYETGSSMSSWRAVVDRSLARSRQRIESAGVVDLALVEAIEAVLPNFDKYFERIKPTPFLDDTTTKNVIISNGRLSGIVDVDQVCFGDPIFTIALTRMSLMSRGAKLDYIEYWCDRIQATQAQRLALILYTGVFCVDFMSEVGLKFNKDSAHIDWEWIERLKLCHAEILLQLNDTKVS